MAITRREMFPLIGSACALPIATAHAQEWPARALRIIVGTAAGGGPDVISRIVAEKLSERISQTVVVENITQGAGAVAQQLVSNAANDGYTLMMMTAGYPPQMALRNVSFDPLEAFSFITMVCQFPMTYTVSPSSPIKTFSALLEHAKKNPGKVSYTINAKGSIQHVLTKWIESKADIEMTPIPYRGAGPALTDVLAGRVDVMVEPATTSFPRVQAGQVRLLAHSGAPHYPLMPGAESVGETVKGIEFMSWLGYVMPPRTPSIIIKRMNMELHHVLRLPEVQRRFVEGGNLATLTTPDEMRAKVEHEMKLWAHIIKIADITP